MMGRQFRSAAIVGALVILVTGLVAGCGTGSTSGPSSPPTTLKPAPDFSGTGLDGNEVSLSQYRGKPLVLAFMASW